MLSKSGTSDVLCRSDNNLLGGMNCRLSNNDLFGGMNTYATTRVRCVEQG